jgi:ribonuclease HII
MIGAQLALDVPESAAFDSHEAESYARGFKSIAGLDEVGRGPLAGPVLAAAVILPRGYQHAGIKDSKLLTAKQREKLASVIQANAISWAVGMVAVEEIDQLNILQASLLAMVKALAALKARADCVLIDGNQTIPWPVFRAGNFLAGISLYQKAIVKGDQSSISIAAASILAKVARDEVMADLDKLYPEYGFAVHKGYGCAAHLEALRRCGPSPAHRRSFKPVREVASDANSIGPLFE